MESLRKLADWVTNNPVLSILIFLGGMGGTLSFFFKINSFSQLVTILKKKANWTHKNILLPLGNLLWDLTRFLLKKLYFIFFQYQYKHLIRLPFYLLAIAVIVIQIRDYQYNKSRYKICLIYDSYANGLGLRDIVKETFQQQLDETDFRYKLDLLEISTGADLSKYDLIVSTVLNADIIVPVYAGLKNDNGLFLDLVNSSKAKTLSNYFPDKKLNIIQFLPDETEKLKLVSRYIDKENAMLLDKGNWYTDYKYLLPENIKRPFDYEYNINLIIPLVKQYRNVLIASHLDLPVLHYLGNSNSRLFYLNPSNYYDTTSEINSTSIQVVPFKDSIAITTFNKFGKTDKDSYFTLISFYIKGFLSFLCNELVTKKDGRLEITDITNKEFSADWGKLKLNDSLRNVYGNYHLFDTKRKKIVSSLF